MVKVTGACCSTSCAEVGNFVSKQVFLRQIVHFVSHRAFCFERVLYK